MSREQQQDQERFHKDVMQCFNSSLSVHSYTKEVKAREGLPIPRSQCPNVLLETDHDIVLVALEDNDLTYAIEVDHTLQVIRIVFRGSLTSVDWLHDFNFRMAKVRNPLLHHEHRVLHDDVLDGPKKETEDGTTSTATTTTIQQSKTIGIHKGFRDYLFGGEEARDTENKDDASITSTTSTSLPTHATRCCSGKQQHADDTKKSTPSCCCKYERIYLHVMRQLTSHPDYHIQLTGHSMGGALATLTAFLLACDLYHDVKQPSQQQHRVTMVTCISFASPRLANGDFGRAFLQLEHAGRLRNLRVVNSDDIVTALPDTSSTAMGLAWQLMRSNFFLHVGICFHMKKKKKQTKTNELLQSNDDDDESSNNKEPKTPSTTTTKTYKGLTNNNETENTTTTADWYFPVVHTTPFRHDWHHRTLNLRKRVVTLYNLAATSIPETHNPKEYWMRLHDEQPQDLLRQWSWESLYEQYFSEKKT